MDLYTKTYNIAQHLNIRSSLEFVYFTKLLYNKLPSKSFNLAISYLKRRELTYDCYNCFCNNKICDNCNQIIYWNKLI